MREKSQRVVMTGPNRGLCRHYSVFCTVIVRILITHLTSCSFLTGPRVTTSLSQKRFDQLLSSSGNLVVLMTSLSCKSMLIKIQPDATVLVQIRPRWREVAVLVV